jgi:hypothetical protein
MLILAAHQRGKVSPCLRDAILQTLTFLSFRFLGGPRAKIFLASKSSHEDRRLLFDSAVPVKALTHFSSYFRDAFEGVSVASGDSCLANVGPDEHGRQTSFAPGQVAQTSGNIISITIMGGDALVDRAFKIVIHWMLDNCESSEAEATSVRLSFTDLVHCMGVMELLAVPMRMKDEVYGRLLKTADNQVPLEDVKILYLHATKDHPARSLVIESIGKAYLERRLKDEK